MKPYKYKIIEYEYKTLTNEKIEVCKTLHKTNSKLLMYFICLCLKLQGIKYEVIK